MKEADESKGEGDRLCAVARALTDAPCHKVLIIYMRLYTKDSHSFGFFWILFVFSFPPPTYCVYEYEVLVSHIR